MVRGADAAVVAFGGDVNLGRRQNAITARDGPQRALGGVPQLADADLAIVNLESVVASGGVQGVEKGEVAPFYFRGRPEMLAVLAAAGIDAVGTANNHSGDYGPEALLEQAALLDRMAIAHPGSGPTRAEACAPAVMNAGPVSLAVFSVDSTMPHFAAGEDTPGTCFVPLGEEEAWRDALGAAIPGARGSADVVLVLVHWGANFETRPSDEKRRAGRLLVELGADAVLGSSAHVLQGVELHHDRPIIHDAGNLLFDSQEGAVDTALFLLELTDDGVTTVRSHPLVAEYGYTRSAEAHEADRILAALDDRSSQLGSEMHDGALSLSPPPRPPVPVRPPRAEPGAAPTSLASPPAECVADAVPPRAAIEPVRLGPLRLVGVRAEPEQLRGREMLWVETFWTIDERVDADLWLSPRARPRDGDGAWRGDHEPCDWAWPTSRWQPGAVYRDRYGLRPPEEIGRGPLEVVVGATDGDETLAVSEPLLRIPIDAP